MNKSFQSTLPREERPRAVWIDLSVFSISIHAPTRGATQSWKIALEPLTISIHAPTRGATNKSILDFSRFEFQSTLPREERQTLNPYSSHSLSISIHAPTRGATKDRICKSQRFRISIHAPTRGATILQWFIREMAGFQSTLPREERLLRADLKITGSEFQSTLPREERQNRTLYRQGRKNFNPRSHERSDKAGINGVIRIIISIHAPTRGATAILHKKFVYFYTIPTINI